MLNRFSHKISLGACFMLLSLMLMLTPTAVYACSGGASMPMSELTTFDVIVYATVLEADERGYSAIMLVDRYIKGAGPLYLPVMQWRPALEVTSIVRGYTTACLYNGGGTEWSTGQQGYFALKYNGDGTYTDGTNGYQPAAYYVKPDSGDIAFAEVIEGEVIIQEMPPAVFEQYLLEHFSTYDAPIPPDPEETRYPLKRFLTITTESGEQYRLNPDRSVTPLNADEAPLAISHDGSHIAFRLDDEHVALQYYELTLQPDTPNENNPIYSQSYAGHDVLFSPNSSLIAIWDDDRLQIYMFDNFEYVTYGQEMELQLIGEHEWSLTASEQTHITWSHNSAVIAFEDGSGIWLWNLFTAAEPELVVQQHKGTLLDISLTGRYVRYGDNTDWQLRDTHTGQQTPNAMATPDEQNLIHFTEFDSQTAYQENDRECSVPLMQTCPVEYALQGDMAYWMWLSNKRMAAITCSEEHQSCYLQPMRWDISTPRPYSRGLNDVMMPFIDALAYDPVYNRPAIAVQDDVIGLSFDFAHKPYYDWQFRRDYVDLSGVLDSPIASLEWGQPLFYDSNYYQLPG